MSNVFYNIKFRTHKNGEQEIRIYENPIMSSNSATNFTSKGESENREKSIESSVNRTRKKLYDYARNNVWTHFVTYTFNKDKTDRYNYSECYSKLQKWLFNARDRKCPNMKWLVIGEQHLKGGWHFHGLLSNCEGLKFTPAIDPSTSKEIYHNGQQVFNIKSYKLGYTTITKIVDTKKASNYITKYITKDLCTNLNQHRYLKSNNLELPQESTDYYSREEIEIIKQNIKKEDHYHTEIVVEKENYKNKTDIFTINIIT